MYFLLLSVRRQSHGLNITKNTTPKQPEYMIKSFECQTTAERKKQIRLTIVTKTNWRKGVAFLRAEAVNISPGLRSVASSVITLKFHAKISYKIKPVGLNWWIMADDPLELYKCRVPYSKPANRSICFQKKTGTKQHDNYHTKQNYIFSFLLKHYLL